MSRLFLCALALCCGAVRAAEPLTVLVDNGTEMPLARMEHGRLTGGIHYDLGMAIAGVLGREARFVVLPRKRVEAALADGEADVMCMYVPEWLPGPLDWTRPFMPFAEVVVTDRRAPRPASLKALAGQRIGTVLGYRHPEIEAVLGKDFNREDGPSAEANLQKMMAGRLQHVIASSIYISYRTHFGDPKLSIHEPLIVKSMRLQCAISRKGHVKADDVSRATARLVRDGEIDRILKRYGD
ncbi:MAG TPA: transporter substrate-binding domain-containing protein [Telluria sp.]|nr:transporter substrate-binding domain-containing protein [Telluria sp.]